jgi:hypothetical protein
LLDGGCLWRGCFPCWVSAVEFTKELDVSTDSLVLFNSHLKLGNLIAIYDDNKISIDGDTNIAFTEDVAKRFEAYDWQVIM